MKSNELRIGDVVTLKDIKVSDYFELDEFIRDDYHLFFGELGVVNRVDDNIVRIGFVRETIDFPLHLVEIVKTYDLNEAIDELFDLSEDVLEEYDEGYKKLSEED